jgi:type I restriction enzyme M protein
VEAELTVTSVHDFVELVANFEERVVAQWFFRGHESSSYKLVARLFRLDLGESFSKIADVEDYLIKTFKQEGAPFVDRQPANGPEWVQLAQHHGVPTRLLDWTTNALIALYFAVEGRFHDDGDVWCMGFPSTNNCLPRSTQYARRTTLRKESRIIFPRHLSPRITNQSGCFTWHDSNAPLNESEEWKAMRFKRVRIKAADKPSILDDLYNLGIHRAFIFPGLDGLARRLVYEVEAVNDRCTEDRDG